MNTLKLVIYIFGTQMNINFCSLARQFLSIKVSKTQVKVFQCLLLTWTMEMNSCRIQYNLKGFLWLSYILITS
jgi:hypothetical protein